MTGPAEPESDPHRSSILDRRHFLLASTGAVLAGSLASCSSTGERPAAPSTTVRKGSGFGANAPTPGEALARPGTAGLVAEMIYQQRADAYLAYATDDPTASGPVGIATHLIRAIRDPGYTWNIDTATVGSLSEVWKKIDNWEDTRDFDLMYLHWLLELGTGSTPNTRLDPELLDAIEQRMLANRYRYDDPLPEDRLDNQWFWSENHRLIGAANEYLAGQRFPDKTFGVTGLTGAEHLARVKPDILEWIHERAEFGWFEWYSNVYLLKDISPLLMLVELADDPEVVTALASLNDFDPAKIATWEQARSAAVNFGFLSEANTYAWRAPEVSLATVLDHRKGNMRDQAHAWQAAIDENAMVFTNHPVTEPAKSTDLSKDGRPGYWTVAERSGAYIALWSWRAPTWRTYDPKVYATRGMVKPFDLVAKGGPDNVWIVEVGTAQTDGDLESFMSSVRRHDPQVTHLSDGFDVKWISPSSGQVEFANTGPFKVKGKSQPLAGFPRHDSPWGTVDHLSNQYALRSEKSRWIADFSTLSRRVA